MSPITPCSQHLLLTAGIPAAHPGQLRGPFTAGHHSQLGLVEFPVPIIPKEVDGAVAVGESPGRARGQPCPVPQAAWVVGLHAQRLLAHHEVLGAFEEDEAAELLEVESGVRVPGQPQGAAFSGKSCLQLGARVAPASAACGERAGLGHGPAGSVAGPAPDVGRLGHGTSPVLVTDIQPAGDPTGTTAGLPQGPGWGETEARQLRDLKAWEGTTKATTMLFLADFPPTLHREWDRQKQIQPRLGHPKPALQQELRWGPLAVPTTGQTKAPFCSQGTA